MNRTQVSTNAAGQMQILLVKVDCYLWITTLIGVGDMDTSPNVNFPMRTQISVRLAVVQAA